MKILLYLCYGIICITVAESCDNAHLKSPNITMSLDKQLPQLSETEPIAKQQPFFLTGTYITFEKNNFCSCWDTLVISRKKNEINVFRIERITQIKFYLSEHKIKTQMQRDTWYGSYDAAEKALHILPGDYSLQLKPETATLELNQLEYQKIE